MNKITIILIGAALITGATNTLGFTLQNKQGVVEYGQPKHFFHPYMQTAMRFLSNSLSLVILALVTHKSTSKQSKNGDGAQKDTQKAPKLNFLMYFIPALLDYASMICYYIALNFISGSVYQILRGGTVLTTYLFSYLCLKTRPTPPKILGCCISLCGLAVVGLVNFLRSSDSSIEKEETLIGYALIIVALFGNGLHFVYEQHLIVKYNASPMKIVGMEGIFGVLISIIIIPILGLIPCNLGKNACVINDSGQLVVQNISVYFREVTEDGLILAGVLMLLVTMSAYNCLSVTIAKMMNSLTRAIVDVTRTVFVWIIGIILTATLGTNNKSFHWESLDSYQMLGESIGFLILIFGNLVYYEVISFKKWRKVDSPSLIEQSVNSEESITKENFE